jgi:hypothetical protein
MTKNIIKVGVNMSPLSNIKKSLWCCVAQIEARLLLAEVLYKVGFDIHFT